MQDLHWLSMLTSQGLDVVSNLSHFHNQIHFYTIVYVLLTLESIVHDHQTYAHVNTKPNQPHEHRNDIHQIHETKSK